MAPELERFAASNDEAQVLRLLTRTAAVLAAGAALNLVGLGLVVAGAWRAAGGPPAGTDAR